ncbi:MAG: hypothetical protein V3T83_19385 [Acidobacteriota bacterium]
MHLFTLVTWDGLTVNPALAVNTPDLLFIHSEPPGLRQRPALAESSQLG